MDLSSKVLLADEEVFKTDDENVYKGIIEYRKKNDSILITDVFDLRIVYREEGETTADFKSRVNAAISVEEMEKHINESLGLFIDFHTEYNGRRVHGVLPLRTISLNSVFERARCNCFSINNFDNGPDYQVLPLAAKVSFVNQAFTMYGGKAKVLFRDRKVTAIMSGQYYFISYDAMDSALNALREDFPNMRFDEANVSHEFFKSTYSLNDTELEEDIALAMESAGTPVEEVRITVSAYTGDHGNVAATFFGQIIMDDKKMLFGSPESVKHSGKKNEDIIKEAAKRLYSSFKNNEEKIKSLPTIKISHPAGCFRLICKEFKLPKKISCSLADALENKSEVTAYEIYWMLNQVVARYEENDADPMRIMSLQEAVAKTLNINYKKYDKEFLWNRGEDADTAA